MWAEFLHYLRGVQLNNPIISAGAGFLTLGMGVFVIAKDFTAYLYRIFFFLTVSVAGWFVGNAFGMLYYQDFDAAIFWFRISYTFVAFMACAYYHTYVVVLNRRKTFLYILYGIAVLEIVFLWGTDYIRQGAVSLPYVGLVWENMPVFSYFLTFGMIKYFSTAIFIGCKLYVRYKSEQEQFKRNQFRNFSIFFFIASAGIIEWLVNFNIPLHVAWAAIPPLVGYFAYSVVRYRFMEIDTVVHKTFLWLISIFLIIVPISIMGLIVFDNIRPALPYWLTVLGFALFLFLFVVYYNRIRPQIDKFFRRKKYDYLEILGAIAQQISGIIDLEELSKKTIAGIKETIYPQNAYLFLKDQESTRYYLKCNFVANEYKSYTKDSSSLFVSENSPTVMFLQDTGHPVERHLLKYDPLYKNVREDSEELFQYTDTQLLFGLVMEEELVGMLLLGKKENLQEYTRVDIDALYDLSLNIAGSFYTSMHHHDILEGQRLLQEVNLARHIQENLLPREAPLIPGVILYGLYMPSKEIGGDYYDFIVQGTSGGDNDRVYITIGDVSGKGMDAGLVVSAVKSFLVSLTRYTSSPREVLNILNQDLYKYLSQQKFISLLLMQYSSLQNKLVYSSAGHERILIYRSSANQVEAVKSGGVILGMIDSVDRFLEEQTLSLDQGDKVLLYTDGATEARNPQEDFYSLPRLKESFQKNSDLPIKQIVQNIYQDIKSFMSTREQYDDITLVGIEKD